MNDSLPSITLAALGGLGEVGMNCLLLEDGDDAILIDCGVMFPDGTTPGVDLIIPDYNHLLERKHKLRAVILTHAHEDHIGGLPFLFDELNVPIYGTAFTLALLKRRMEEREQDRQKEREKERGKEPHQPEEISGLSYITVRPGDKVQLGRIGVEFIGTYHSIIGSTALAIRTSVGTIIHTGDFKIDAHPTSGKGMDLQRFKELGQEGVKLLMSDSTNVERLGHSISEQAVKERFYHYFSKAEGRVFVTLFASHIDRIAQVIEISAQFNRRVVLLGRSLLTNTAAAAELGLLAMDPGQVSDNAAYAEKLPPGQVTVILTGCQGEARSALTRVATGEHETIKVRKGDLVIFSSRSIPGNERALHGVINLLYRGGADVLYENVADVHASGHAHQDELRELIELVRPRFFMPVHGEYRHLALHARLADEYSFIKDKVVALDGDLVEVWADQIKHTPSFFEAGRVFLDGLGRGDVEGLLLRDRRQMARAGILLATMLVDSRSGRVVRPPRITQVGVFESADADEQSSSLLKEAEVLVEEAVERMLPSAREDREELEAEIRLELRKFARKRLGKRPIIIPIIITT